MVNLRRGVFLAALSLTCACANVQTSGGVSSAEEIAASATSSLETTAQRIRADIAWLADDARMGREAGTPGYRAAANYVAARMTDIGLQPGAEGEWFQYVPLRSARTANDLAAMSVTDAGGDTQTFSHFEDFRLFPSLAKASFDLSAPAVFVGYGVHAPEAGHDDYEGLDLDGKIVVFFGGAPDIFASEERAHYGSSGAKAAAAARRGALGAIILQTAEGEERSPWGRIVSNPDRVSMTWVAPDGQAETSGLKGSAVLNPAASEALFQGAPRSFADVRAEADRDGGAPKGFDLAVSVTLSGANISEDIKSPNVVGLLRGSDPQLRDEYVVLTAHLDHTGVNDRLVAQGKDGLHNGAMDNALGVSVMLEVARMLKEGQAPARSVVFLALTAEEKGLLGADYFVHYPPASIGAIVANVNLDMPVMLHAFTDVIAFGAERSSLGPITQAAVEAAGLTLSPDPFPQLGVFTRSDHYRFVEKGVPAVYLFPGFANGGEEMFNTFMAKHYHRPSDDISLPIRYDDAARFADVNFDIARAIANMPERPTWNEGDFFGDLFAGER